MAEGMKKLADAYVQIIPSAQGIKGSISSVLNPEMTSAGQQSGQTLGANLIGVAKKLLLGAGLGMALKQSLTEGGELQQSLGGVETLFKDSADRVIANAERAFETVGLSANEYMATITGFSASLLQSLDGDTQKAAEYSDRALIDMSDKHIVRVKRIELYQRCAA